MALKPEGDMTKLPKWAQSHIAVLEMRVREMARELEVSGNVEATDVRFRRPSHFDYEFIPPSSEIAFTYNRSTLGRRRDIRVRLHEDGGILVNGDGCLRVVMQSGNSFRVEEAP